MLTLLLISVVCCLLAYKILGSMLPPKNFPPGPQGLPIIGCSSLLRKLSKELGGQHKAFEYLGKKFNTPVIGLKLGSQLVVVATAVETAREVMSRDEFLGRPDSFFMRLRCFGAKRGITFADGELWHEQRTFTLRTLRDLGMGRPLMESLVQEQVKQLIQQFAQGPSRKRPIEILSQCIIRVLWEVVAGHRFAPDEPRLLRLMDVLNQRNRAFDMAGGILNQLPWLRYIAPEWSGYKLLTELNAEMRAFLMEAVEEHKKTYKAEETRDLIDAFLHELNNPKIEHNSFSEEQLLMVLLDLFLGGASSTTATLDFAFLMMLIHPDVQEKVYQEINDVIGLKLLPTSADRARLPYTEAVMLEVQRFCTVIPVNGPRRVLKETTIAGYTLPKNTTVLMSLWSVHRDPTLFPDPYLFRPERFLDPNTRNIMTENVVTFGLGKRRCLGESLAKPCLFLIFAAIVQAFKLEIADPEEKLSADPVPGIILTTKPYTAIFKRRISNLLVE